MKKDIITICNLFNLGTLQNWRLTNKKVAGLNEIIFNTENFKNQKYYFRAK